MRIVPFQLRGISSEPRPIYSSVDMQQHTQSGTTYTAFHSDSPWQIRLPAYQQIQTNINQKSKSESQTKS